MLYTYIPVNINRTSCAVVTQRATFPEEYLLRAYKFVTEGEQNGTILTELNTIKFDDNPDYVWKLSDLYMAYMTYKTAVENDFSFYTAMSWKDIPALYISKAFKGCRILINAFTFEGFIVQRPELVSRIAYLMDKSFPYRYCSNVYNTVKDLENHSTSYIKALICYRDTEDETLIVSKPQTLYSERVDYYGYDIIDQFREFLDNQELTETDDLIKENKRIKHKSLQHWPLMPISHLQNIVDLYDKCIAKKSNYHILQDADYEPCLYFSTNYRYLVNADTLECRIVTNESVKRTLISATQQTFCNIKDMLDWWELAAR